MSDLTEDKSLEEENNTDDSVIEPEFRDEPSAVNEANEAVETKQYRPAGFFIRLLAYIFDLLVIMGLTSLLINPSQDNFLNSGHILTYVNLYTVGITGSLYFFFMTLIFRQTIGKMIFGLEVISTDGKNPGFGGLIFREIIGRFISQLAGLHLGYLWAAFHPLKQSWHDKIADTYVVHKTEKAPVKYIEIN